MRTRETRETREELAHLPESKRPKTCRVPDCLGRQYPLEFSPYYRDPDYDNPKTLEAMRKNFAQCRDCKTVVRKDELKRGRCSECQEE